MALDIASRFPEADQDFVYDASLLHDVGIIKTHAPSIFCNGDEPYIRHGILGAEMLRGIDASMEPYARVCERHTGAGISAAEIERDMIPVTLEEKIVCYADKFFSKSKTDTVKTVDSIREDLAKFGEDQLARFDAMNALLNH